MLTFPPDCTYTAEQRKVCELFAERMQLRGLTEAEAGADIGYVGSSVSSLLGGRYGASPAAICKRIRLLLDAEAREAKAVAAPAFVETEIVREIFGYCENRRDSRSMGYICGAPGNGRTMALAEFAARNESVLYISARAAVTPTSLLRAVATALGIADKEQSKRRLALSDQIVAILRVLRGGLLILDEADRIISLEIADAARDLWEESACGMVLSGTTRLLRYLDDHYDSLAGQIRRRFRDILYLPALDQKGVDAILAQYPDWPDELRKLANERCRGNTGRLCAAVQAARTHAAGATPTRKQLEAAFLALA